MKSRPRGQADRRATTVGRTPTATFKQTQRNNHKSGKGYNSTTVENYERTTYGEKDFNAGALSHVHGRLKVQTLEQVFSTTRRDTDLIFGLKKDINKVSM
jgi:hypothetical protein